MIMQWKKQVDGHYMANWQNIAFTLYENPTNKRWQLLSNGQQVRETWNSARRAMEMIESRQQQLILAAMHGSIRAEPNLEPTPAKPRYEIFCRERFVNASSI